MNELPVDALPDPEGLGLSWVILFLLGLVLLASYLHRRFGQPVRGDALRMVSSLSLGDKRAIVMIEADSERLLLGVTSSNVQLLSHLPNAPTGGAGVSTGATGFEDVAGNAKRNANRSPGVTGTFRSLLRAATAKKART